VDVAGLKTARDAARLANPAMAQHWLVVRDWSEHARYEMMSAVQANELFVAVCDPNDGVLQWIRAHW
jgi:hypothetical protein